MPGETQLSDVKCTEPSDERMLIDPVPRHAYSIKYGLVGVKVGSDADPSAYVSPTKSGMAAIGSTGVSLGKPCGICCLLLAVVAGAVAAGVTAWRWALSCSAKVAIPAATTAMAAAPIIRLSTLRRGRATRGSKFASAAGGCSALMRSYLARSLLRSSGSMSIILELLSQGGETALEVSPHGAGSAPHKDGALLDGVAVVVVERDRGALFARQPPVRTIHVDARAVGAPARRGRRTLGRVERRPATRAHKPPTVEAVVDADARQPCLGPIDLRHGLPGLPRPKKCLLNRVLGLATVIED